MTPRLRRLLLVATSAAVAVLAVVCVALSHHYESSGRPAVAGPTAAAAGSVPNGHDGPASHHGPVDQCATTDLVACVRPSIGMAGALALLVVTGLTVLLHGRANGLPWGERALRRLSGIDGPRPGPGQAPSLMLLCVSRT